MSLRLLRMMVADGLRALVRGRGLTVAALLIIALTFSVSALALLTAGNLSATVARHGRPGTLRVYFEEGTADTVATALARSLRQRPTVESVLVVPADEARERFLKGFPEMAPGVAMLEENPFPPHLEVALIPGHGGMDRDELRTALAGEFGVVAVLGDDLWTGRLLGLSDFVRRVGLAAGLAFAMASALVVAGVTRLSLAARRDEIEVMWVVGAQGAFISGPFVVEGVLLGAGGALLSWATAWAVFKAASVMAAEHPLLGFLGVAPLPLSSALFLLLCAVMAGAGGALLTVFQAGRGR